jgi:poly-beta-1,6-N-acetyl-D-glucosamine synthase
MGLTYAAVTPARDEAENLPRLAAALLAQSVVPVRWIVVENGSSDGTDELVRRLAAEHEWIQLLQTEASAAYDRTSPYMRAWHAGVEALGGAGDVVVKLDADVSFEPGYFAEILAAFAADDRLGIASGSCHEWRDGAWRAWVLAGDHVWGPTRSYRRACLDVVLPLDDSTGYAAIDVTKAQLAGYRVRCLHELPFRHHRPEGAGEGSRRQAWLGEGESARYVGYRFTWVLGRCLYRLRHDPAALALPVGYLRAALRRAPVYGDADVRAALRETQRLRNGVQLVLRRLRERRLSRARSAPSASPSRTGDPVR